MRSFPGNPYDGHTLAEQLEQSSILMEATGIKPETVYADLGYRCHLKGPMGDAIHAVLCATGFNIKWLLRMIARKGILPFFLSLFYTLKA